MLPSLFDQPTDLSNLLRLIYEVGADGHKHQKRTKIGFTIPYIKHPIIVYKILRAVNIDEPIALAAAFLHDVMEDNPSLKDPRKLAAKITRKLRTNNIPDPEKIAYEIVSLCEELTNAEIMEGGKRAWQFDHAHKLSPRAKQIKIADQMASLIEDVILPSNRPNSKLRTFDMKAREVAIACAGDNQLLDNLFKVCFTDAMAIIDSQNPDALPWMARHAQKIRSTFTLESALLRAAQYPLALPSELPTQWRIHPRVLDAKTGIINLGLTKKGEVCRFTALVDPHRDDSSSCNAPLIRCINALESTTPFRATHQTVGIVENRIARPFKLKPSMNLNQFLKIAYQQGSIEKEFAQNLGLNPRTISSKEFSRNAALTTRTTHNNNKVSLPQRKREPHQKQAPAPTP